MLLQFHVTSVKQAKWTSFYNAEFFENLFLSQMPLIFVSYKVVYLLCSPKNDETTVSQKKTERPTSIQVRIVTQWD